MFPKLNKADFTYFLSEEKIAHYPVSPRDTSKLLYFNQKQKKIEHRKFSEISDILPPNSVLVFNQSKVIRARLLFKKDSGTTIEIFLLSPKNQTLEEALRATENVIWECMIGNKKRWKKDEKLIIDDFSAELLEENEIKFTWGNGIFSKILEKYGKVPLPPYVKRSEEKEDSSNYQTIYSKHEGSVAAPTAGLHFTENSLQILENKGITKLFITLHVGAGTFQPLKSAQVADHPMHAENICLTKEEIRAIAQNKRPIVAVGTTSVRALESLYWIGYKLITNETNPFFIEKEYIYAPHEKFSKEESFAQVINYLEKTGQENLSFNTQIMIVPGYEFRICEGIITNFHQPNSTLLLLIAAWVGEDWKKIYQEALENNYRFLSYGDACFLDKI